MIDNEKLTFRKCANLRCPGHMAHRIVKVCKRFNVKNIGPASALDYIRDYKLDHHIQIIPYLFKEKPKLYVWEIGELAMIPGWDSRWRDLAGQSDSMLDFLQSFRCPAALRQEHEVLLYVEKFFEVKQPLKGKVIKVMMTGSINNFNNRADFIRTVNTAFGQYIQLVDVGTRKTGVDYLIKEPHTVDHTKSGIANDYGIPIITSSELVRKIGDYVAERRRIENADE